MKGNLDLKRTLVKILLIFYDLSVLRHIKIIVASFLIFKAKFRYFPFAL